ncbi:MAG: Biopolymer transport protein ExbD/TolR [Myxococcales bacterium]|nr:Biopolymer transport protein ExbD/TolR [Myxococcales bacterium]
MAGGSIYKDDDDAAAITDINVTPFVDVVLVLLVVFMVTAKLIVARGVEIDKPKETIASEVKGTLRISITASGDIYVDGNKLASDAETVARIRRIASTYTKPKALIAGDRKAPHGAVMHAIELVQEADITALALENERP